MKQKLLILTILFITLAIFTHPVTAHAFWPFDQLFGQQGQVQGDQTDTTPQPPQAGFFQALIQKLGLSSNQTPIFGQPRPGIGLDQGSSGAMGSTGTMMPNLVVGQNNSDMMEGRITQLLNSGKLTDAQKTELTNQLSAIKTKRQELMNLMNALQAWLKSNNLMMGPTGASGRGGIKPPQGMMQEQQRPGSTTGGNWGRPNQGQQMMQPQNSQQGNPPAGM